MKALTRVACLLAIVLFGMWPAFSRQDPGEIEVGVLFSSSGTMAQSESPLKDATLLAIRQINEAGGIFLPPERRLIIRPLLADGASRPGVFAQEAGHLLDRGVRVIFGCWTSDSRKAVIKAIESRGGLLYYPVQFEGREQSPAVIYSGLTANQQLFPALDYVQRNFGSRVYLVGSDYIYPRTTNQLCRRYLSRHGGSVVGESYRPRGSEDFAAIVEAIKRTPCDAVLNTINGDSQKAFFEQVLKAKLARPIMSLSLSETQAAAMGSSTDGHYAAWGYFSSLQTPQSLRFQRAYSMAYGADRVVDDPCQTAYSQVMAFAHAVSAAGTSEPGSLRRAMRALILDTPAGLVRYDPKNLYCWRAIRIGQFKAGRASIVWSSELPIKPEPEPRL